MKKRQSGTTPPVLRHARHLLATTLLLSVAPVMAQDDSTHAFHLAAQPLNRTLLSIAAESGVALSYDPKLVESVNAAPVSGTLSANR